MKLSLKNIFSSKTFAGFGIAFVLLFFVGAPAAFAKYCLSANSAVCFETQDQCSNRTGYPGQGCVLSSGSSGSNTATSPTTNLPGQGQTVDKYCLSANSSVCFETQEQCKNRTGYPGQGCVPTRIPINNTGTTPPPACSSLMPGASCVNDQGKCDTSKFTNVGTTDCDSRGQVCCVPAIPVIQIPNDNTPVVNSTVAPVHEGSGLVPCGSASDQPGAAEDCNFNWFITGIQTIINFLLFTIAMPLSAIAFAVAGWMLMTAGGSESKVSEAKKIFTNVAIGLAIALGAWLLVHAIVSGLGVSSQFSQFLGK